MLKHPPAGQPLMKILGIVLYPPGAPPIQVDGERVLVTRVEGGVTVVGTLNADGQLVTFVGMPYQLISEQSAVVGPGLSTV
jgi:hypothetical protein